MLNYKSIAVYYRLEYGYFLTLYIAQIRLALPRTNLLPSDTSPF